MKFTAGYLLGAATIVGLGASFVGGLFFASKVNEIKNTKLQEAKDEDIIDALKKLVKNKGQ